MLNDDLIYLRKLERDDLERTWKWINTPEIFYAIGSQIPISKSNQEKWFERIDNSTEKIVFAVCLKENGNHIGNVSLFQIDLRHRNAGLSIFIADNDNRAKGTGSRAIKLLLDYAFNFLNLHKVFLKMTADDEKVKNFYEKLGFVVEGRLREHEYIDGKYVDKLTLSILKSEFQNPQG